MIGMLLAVDEECRIKSMFRPAVVSSLVFWQKSRLGPGMPLELALVWIWCRVRPCLVADGNRRDEAFWDCRVGICRSRQGRDELKHATVDRKPENLPGKLGEGQ